MFDIESAELCCGLVQFRAKAKIENSSITLKVTPGHFSTEPHEPFHLSVSCEEDVINIKFSQNDSEFVLPRKSSFEFSQHGVTISLEKATYSKPKMPISIKARYRAHFEIIPHVPLNKSANSG